MTTRMRSLRNFRNPIGCLILLAALGAAAGCSNAENPTGSATNMNHVLPSGSSVPGWLVVPSGGSHASTATQDYIATGGGSGCTECHGSDLSGGISGTSCFSNPAGCHHQPVVGWVAPPPGVQNHGVSAKKAPGSSGFASCQICHGNNFSGGGAKTPCSSCHVVSAPHPARPWRGSPYTHTNTDTANAPVCAQCHFPGSPNNPANHPATPAPAGTAPGCFNNTLCHGEGGVPHPVGATWVTTSPAAQPHGNDAKAAPGTTTGFDYCKVCHGTGNTFTGGAAVSCYPCHGNVGTPHPSQWRTGDTYVHTTTNTGNASVCAFCHTAGANSPIAPPPAPAPGAQPDCFNNTLCHGAGGAPHPVGATWVTTAPAAQPHGNSAKATPGSTAGFDYCKVCHGTGNTFTGGTAVSCYPCHGNVGTPHPSQWRTGDTYLHTSTAGGNAPVCAFCHTAGANSPIAPPPAPAPGAQPDCFNNTLCHGAGGAPHPVGATWVTTAPAAQPHGNSAKATPGSTAGFDYCKVCHGTGNTFTGGTAVSCYPCHGNVGTPHPSQWRTGDTYLHTSTAGGNAPVCAFCHTAGANSPIAPPPAPAPGATPDCFNNTLCHGAGGAPHPVGATWVTTAPAAQPHGNSAKATPGSTAGFDYCKVCHGTGNTFTGGTAVSCYPCHGNVGTPHPSQWRTGDTYVHTSTAGGNAPVCAFCHTAGANSPIAPPPAPAPGATPDCFNNTLCHAAGIHPAGWAQSSQHGPAAKAAPSASGGFSFCKTCHGTGTTPPANFGGGTSGTSCYPCHGLNAPHPSSWVGGGPPHRTTNQGQANLDVCAECHRSTAGTAGCFNNTLCHN